LASLASAKKANPAAKGRIRQVWQAYLSARGALWYGPGRPQEEATLR
jgi:hypothetical protein